MKTIATFSKPEEAHLLRMRLEAGGVPAYVLDEHLIQADWFYSDAIGGVRLQVADHDVEAAREIMGEPGEPLEGVAYAECPACRSSDVAISDLPRRMSFLSILLLRFPIPPGRTLYRCKACGQSWRGS